MNIKNILHTTVLIALCYGLLACLPPRAANSPPPPAFEKTFGGEGFDRGMFINHTSDGGYIACGYSTSFSQTEDVYVLKLDKNGALEWQKSYGTARTDMGWGIIESSNGGYVLHGTNGSTDGTNDDVSIRRLNATGEVLWEKHYGNEKDERVTFLQETSDGNWLLIGQRTQQSGVNIDSYVLKTDTSGQVLWEKTFGGPGIERTFYGAETPAGDYLLTGLTLPYDNNKADILILKISRNGELLFQKTWGEKEVHDIAHSCSRNSDGKSYTLTGYMESAKPGFHDGLWIQLDEAGNVLSTTRHQTGEDLRLMHAAGTADKGWVVAGYTRKDVTQNIWDAVLLKYDRSGQVQWLKTFGTPEKDDQGYWLTTDKSGAVTFTGYTKSTSENGDLWVVRVRR